VHLPVLQLELDPVDLQLADYGGDTVRGHTGDIPPAVPVRWLRLLSQLACLFLARSHQSLGRPTPDVRPYPILLSAFRAKAASPALAGMTSRADAICSRLPASSPGSRELSTTIDRPRPRGSCPAAWSSNSEVVPLIVEGHRLGQQWLSIPSSAASAALWGDHIAKLQLCQGDTRALPERPSSTDCHRRL
jgi:hypothetical protein